MTPNVSKPHGMSYSYFTFCSMDNLRWQREATVQLTTKPNGRGCSVWECGTLRKPLYLHSICSVMWSDSIHLYCHDSGLTVSTRGQLTWVALAMTLRWGWDSMRCISDRIHLRFVTPQLAHLEGESLSESGTVLFIGFPIFPPKF